MTINGKGKGKAVAAKRKRCGVDDDKTGGGRKRNNRGVLQFFEDSACVDEDDDDCDDSEFDDDFVDEEIDNVQQTMNEPPKGGYGNLPFVKEEEIDEEEFDRMMEARYGENSRFISFAGDEFDDKIIESDTNIPTIWKVKCTVGRERLSAFSLMQKFADLKALGTKLEIISAFAVDHMKGFVYIEAERQCDIHEACKGIPGIYVSRVQPVPRNEISHLFTIRKRNVEISEGMWARIKSGNYKGDLAQVVAVNNTSKKVTVKLVPRIDLQALAAKFGGGYSRQKTAIPAPRLISSSELEEFRPLIQFRRDRDTGKVFEVLDGLLLKDGYVFKKVSPDSLNLWGVVPTEEELLKFGPSENNESKDLEFLAQLYGDSKKKKRIIRDDKGGGKGESSSGSGVTNGFELYDLVCFGKKDFGVIVSMDKDDTFKILKENPDGPLAVTVERHDIKSGLFDLKLSAQDQHRKAVVVNDTVRVLEGPSKDRQGIVRHIYRGILFLYDENLEENGGYFTCKSHMCEKIKLTVEDFCGKDSEPGPSVFDDLSSSPRSPLSLKKPWPERENNREFNRGNNNNLFNIGQTLRIRIGPLKGYLCRVIAIRRNDVTVKLDSQQKVLTVKCEHLSDVQAKSTAAATSGDPDSSSLKPFDLLGTDGGSGGWMDGMGAPNAGGGWDTGGASAERPAGEGWNAGGASAERPVAGGWNAGGASAERPAGGGWDAGWPSAYDTVSQGVDGSAWESKSTSNQNSSWGAAVENTGIASDTDQSGGWGKGGGSWGGAEKKTASADDNDGNQPSGWGSKNNWNATKTLESESSGLKPKCDEHCKDVEQKGQPAWKNMTNDSSSSGWNTSISSSQVSAGWNQKPTGDNKEENVREQSGWGVDKGSDGSASCWEKGTSDGEKRGSAWGSQSSSDTGWKNGSSERAKEGEKHSKNANWSSGGSDAGSHESSWGKKSSWNSGQNGNQPTDKNNVSWNSGSGDSNKTCNWGKDSSSGSAEDENKMSRLDSSNCNWGKNNNWNSNNSSGNENKNSSWSSGRNDAENQESSWAKKSKWNSGNSGNQITDQNNSNWNSGSSDSNQHSKWGKSSNSSNNSSWSAGAAENSSKRGSDSGNQDSGWGKKSNWSAGNASGGDNDGRNETSDDGDGGNWRGGYRGRGGFRGRGFGGRGDRGGWGGRGRSDGEDSGGGWDSERGGFGGRGRGRSDQSSSWSNSRDSGRDGSSDWKKEGDSNDGWKNSSGSGSWSQGGGSNKQWSSWGSVSSGGSGGDKDGQSMVNAGKDRPSWNQGGGSNKLWPSWGSGSGGGGGDKDGQSMGSADKERPSWNRGGGSDKQWSSWGSGSSGTSCNQADGDKGEQSLGNLADKGCSSWKQGGESNKQGSGWGSGSSGSTWNSSGSKLTDEAKVGEGWTSQGAGVSTWNKSTSVEGTNIQEGGWNKGSNSNNQDKGWKTNSNSNSGNEASWGQPSSADQGQSSGWHGSSDGAASSWGKSNDGDKKGGW